MIPSPHTKPRWTANTRTYLLVVVIIFVVVVGTAKNAATAI